MASDNTEKNGAESDRPPTKETNGKDLHIDLEDLDESADHDSNLNESDCRSIVETQVMSYKYHAKLFIHKYQIELY